MKREPNVRVIVHDKSSLAPEGKPVAFCLDPKTGFSWVGKYDITAEELLSGAGGNTATKTEQAERLILDLLADGKELASEEIVKAAAEAGISERTVQNAKRNMGGILGARRVGVDLRPVLPVLSCTTFRRFQTVCFLCFLLSKVSRS